MQAPAIPSSDLQRAQVGCMVGKKGAALNNKKVVATLLKKNRLFAAARNMKCILCSSLHLDQSEPSSLTRADLYCILGRSLSASFFETDHFHD